MKTQKRLFRQNRNNSFEMNWIYMLKYLKSGHKCHVMSYCM